MAVMRPVLLGLLLLATLLAGILTGIDDGSVERPVVINEVAWAGTAASSNDEWIELYNNTDQDIDLTGWRLKSDDGNPDIQLAGTIPARGFFLLERGDDTTVSDIPADQIYQGALTNPGETLRLFDPDGQLIDSANGDGGPWPGGTDAHGKPPYATMERVDPQAGDTDGNWKSNDGVKRCGLDARGNPINGTPKALNSAFNRRPIADFTSSRLRPLVDEIVTFDGSSSFDPDPDGRLISFQWAFGDGAIGEGQTTSHKYEKAGSYTVRLTVTDDRGAQGEAAKELTVREGNIGPQANFIFTPEQPTVEHTVHFFDQSTDDSELVSWLWDFGDGSTSVLRNPSHQYPEPGSYTVTLTVTDDDGATAAATAELAVLPVNLPPVADFSYWPLEPTTQDEVQFIDQSSDDGEIVAWHWDFGDGSTAEVQSPSHRYAKSGKYMVTLTVTDDRGWTDDTAQEISVRGVPPRAAFSASPQRAYTGEPIKFDASESHDPDGDIVKYEWDFGDGESGSGKIVEHAYNKSGEYTVTLRVTDDDYDEKRTATAQGTVQIINRPPKPGFRFSPEEPTDADTIQFTDDSSDPDGRVVRWLWEFGDGSSSIEQNPTHQYQVDGEYEMKLTVWDDEGAKDTISRTIRVRNAPPVAAFSFSPEQPRVGEPVQFIDLSYDPSPTGSIVSWGWAFGDDPGSTCPPGCGSGNWRNPTHQYATPGTYIVTLTVIDNKGKLTRTTKEVTIAP